MNNTTSIEDFHPRAPDAAGVLSWIHIGDLHMVKAGDRNHLDLQSIVAEINQSFAGAISFVYLPGDNADNGSAEAYAVVRQALDKLQAPWCAIVGDHDVHEKSFTNFRNSMSELNHYDFSAGNIRFLAMNAFDIPEPPSFTVLPSQLEWLEEELTAATAQGMSKVLLLHCYPSDLKVGGEELNRMVVRHDVTLVDMGHTHYNEIANDGRTLYTATRSTGQIEEGPVGFSVINIDNGAVSWRFFELEQLPALMITSPSDERMVTELNPSKPFVEGNILRIRAKIWSKGPIANVYADMAGEKILLRQIPLSPVWEAEISTAEIEDGVYSLRVIAVDADGVIAEDTIRVSVGRPFTRQGQRAQRDQDNALAAWPEHGLLGTQLGPNKNGRKW